MRTLQLMSSSFVLKTFVHRFQPFVQLLFCSISTSKSLGRIIHLSLCFLNFSSWVKIAFTEQSQVMEALFLATHFSNLLRLLAPGFFINYTWTWYQSKPVSTKMEHVPIRALNFELFWAYQPKLNWFRSQKVCPNLKPKNSRFSLRTIMGVPSSTGPCVQRNALCWRCILESP